jgi:hypothetical protein
MLPSGAKVLWQQGDRLSFLKKITQKPAKPIFAKIN